MVTVNLLDLVMIGIALFALGGIAGHRFLPSRNSPRHVWLEQREMAWMALSTLIWEDCTDSVQKAILIATKSNAQGPPHR